MMSLLGDSRLSLDLVTKRLNVAPLVDSYNGFVRVCICYGGIQFEHGNHLVFCEQHSLLIELKPCLISGEKLVKHNHPCIIHLRSKINQM